MKFQPLTESLLQTYQQIEPQIKSRLQSFKNITEDQYFYELCFCLCTPFTKAKNAVLVQEQLMKNNFKENDIDVTSILRMPEHYIRFHNKKSEFLYELKMGYSSIEQTIILTKDSFELRNYLRKNVKGLSFKESSHFLRNIGRTGLAIIDRHTFKNLCNLKVVNTTTPYPTSKQSYLEIEKAWIEYSEFVGISLEELDFLFFYNQTKSILK